MDLPRKEGTRGTLFIEQRTPKSFHSFSSLPCRAILRIHLAYSNGNRGRFISSRHFQHAHHGGLKIHFYLESLTTADRRSRLHRQDQSLSISAFNSFSIGTGALSGLQSSPPLRQRTTTSLSAQTAKKDQRTRWHPSDERPPPSRAGPAPNQCP